MSDPSTEQPLDLIWGIAAIAKVISRTETQTYHMLATGAVPAKNVNRRWVADRAELNRFFRGYTNGQN